MVKFGFPADGWHVIIESDQFWMGNDGKILLYILANNSIDTGCL